VSLRKTWLLRGLALFVFFIILLLSGYNYMKQRNLLIEEGKSRLRWASHVRKLSINLFLENTEKRILHIASTPGLPELITRERRISLETFLKNTIKSYPDILGMGILSRDRRFLATYSLEGFTRDDFVWGISFLEGGISFLGLKKPPLGKPALLYVVAVPPTESPKGYLTVALDLSPLEKLLKGSVGLGKTEKTYLLNEDGSFIAYAPELPPEGILALKIDPSTIIPYIDESGTGVYRDFKGTKVVGAFLRFEKIRGYIGSEIKEDEILTPLKSLYFKQGTIILLSLILLLFLFLLKEKPSEISKSIIERLKLIEKGELTPLPMDVEGTSLTISKSFNKLLEKIHQLERDLEERVLRSGKDWEVLYNVTTAAALASSKLDMERKVLETLKNSLDIDIAAIRVYDPKRGELTTRSVTGIEENLKDKFEKHLLKNNIVYGVIESDRIKIINRPHEEENLDEEARNILSDKGIKQIVYIPLRAKGGVVGILFMGTGREREWEGEEKTLEAIAKQLGLALERINLYEETKRLNQEILEKNIELRNLVKQLETTTRTKSYFLAAVSHELRTPLNAILGFSELLLSGSYGELTDDQRKPIENIHQAGKHLLDLINDILDLARIEAGREELKLKTLNVRETLERLLQIVKGSAAKKSIDIFFEVDPNLPVIEADEKKFKQILFNLLSNAVKFTPKRGKIYIKARKVGNQAFFSVTDTGIGIKEEDLERIFEPFVQIEEGPSKSYAGAGLGLTLVREYVHLHGGEVWAESEGPGKGSTFTFTLPIRKEILEEEVQRTPEISKGAPVLVIEEDPHSAELYMKIMEEAGLEVLWARDGEEGLKLAKDKIPKAIIMDLLLPKKDGWEVIEELKRDPLTKGIPIIVVSILSEEKRAREMGVDDYIVKPVTRERLTQNLKSLKILENPSTRVIVVEVEGYEKMVETLKGMGFSIETLPPDKVNGKTELESKIPIIKSWRDLNRLLASYDEPGPDEELWWHPKSWREV
jgi:signal transduction histidine kinase/CheY-like chemotaxis protein